MSNAENMVRLAFSALGSLLAVSFGYGYHCVNYHNAVEHMGAKLPELTRLVVALSPWMFLVPVAVLAFGIVLRRRPLGVLVMVNVGWLTAVAWPPLCLWAWAMPETIL